jgi:hypothetical protein
MRILPSDEKQIVSEAVAAFGRIGEHSFLSDAFFGLCEVQTFLSAMLASVLSQTFSQCLAMYGTTPDKSTSMGRFTSYKVASIVEHWLV